ncbi:TOMM precursor leader peptide-binding protein [Streptomyces sp. MAR4 CNX-425]|uniref:TOMM precursor leader peptide-binding protein n=1 Tax=Streptomyces sp. MAR4 CNX-425 TaxID=3406343 RepID=UPI003B502A68
MASAVRVRGVGGFGERTARLLAAQLPDAETRGEADLLRGLDGSPGGVVVVAAWRPLPGLTELVDEFAYRTSTSWLPVVMENSVVRVGPLVRPPQGPCFRCYRERRRQHDRQQALTAALHTAYDEHPDRGPGGHLPHHARLAAAVAAGVLQRGRAGEVTVIRLGAWGVDTYHVVPWHDCPRCGDFGVGHDPGSLRMALAEEERGGRRARSLPTAEGGAVPAAAAPIARQAGEVRP